MLWEQVVPAEAAGDGDAEQEEDPSLLHDEVLQAMRGRKAKLHRYSQTAAVLQLSL